MKKICLLALTSLVLNACAARIEPNYPVPEIPNTGVQTSKLHGMNLSIEPFLDARLPAIKDQSNVIVTQPDGEVAQIVEQALNDALLAQGVALDGNDHLEAGLKNNVVLSGQIRRWDSKVKADYQGSLQSNATIFLELKDSDGRELFSGEFHGSRSSTFPVIAKQDVGDSLGIAMSEAIKQAMKDQNLHKALSKANSKNYSRGALQNTAKGSAAGQIQENTIEELDITPDPALGVARQE